MILKMLYLTKLLMERAFVISGITSLIRLSSVIGCGVKPLKKSVNCF